MERRGLKGMARGAVAAKAAPGELDLDDIKTMQASTALGGDGELLFRGADSDKGLGAVLDGR